jgi:hypothetical protein
MGGVDSCLREFAAVDELPLPLRCAVSASLTHGLFVAPHRLLKYYRRPAAEGRARENAGMHP